VELVVNRTKSVNVDERERWASVIGGGALVAYGISRRSWGGLGMALIGGEMIFRGATGHCPMYQAFGLRTADKGQGAETTSVPYESGVRVDKSIVVNRAPDDLFRFWRNLENLPTFMDNLESVKMLDDKRSHWITKGPAGKCVEWDAEIINEKENELIGWRSLEGSDVDSAGSVHFQAEPGGRGTLVKISLQYNPPGGAVGAALAKLFGGNPEQQIQDDLRRFKQLMETGEIATTRGQSKGNGGMEGASSKARSKRTGLGDQIEDASEASFPASDAPSWNSGQESLRN